MSGAQWVTVLGATGSIGVSTLDVLDSSGAGRVFALTARHNVSLLLEQCRRWQPVYAVLVDPQAAAELASQLAAEGSPTEVLSGTDSLSRVACDERVDTVMAAIVGAAGLVPTLDAARAGKKILLANKEALVMAGELFMQAVRENHATILPIDSEHNAIFQCLPEQSRLPGQAAVGNSIRRVLLTASGGPFLELPLEDLETVTPERACKHPNWSMGQKISVDSASMMNKGLEFIEACHLFALPPSQVNVLIHPQSIVHSMVEYHDGSVLAQMGSPDMRVPIAYGLAWPERIPSGAEFLDLVSSADLQFRQPDLERFPCLALGMEAAARGGATCIAVNAANEVAVEAFLAGHIRFTDIPLVIRQTMHQAACREAETVAIILRLDAEARQLANEQLEALARS